MNIRLFFPVAGTDLDGVMFHNSTAVDEMPDLKLNDSVMAASTGTRGDESSLNISGVVTESQLDYLYVRRGQNVTMKDVVMHYTDKRPIEALPLVTKDFIVMEILDRSS